VVLFAPAGIMGFLRRRTALSPPIEQVPVVRGSTRQGVCLQVEQATKDFGGLRAVDNVSFEVRFGQIVALIGPNGAGKSTLFNLVSGVEPMSSGRIVLEGTDVARTPIHRRAAEIGRSFQVPRLVPDMTTLDNVAARTDHLPGRAQHSLALARAQLAAFALEGYATRLVREIGLGFHKLIELARASGGEPALLLLDEPAVGLTSDEVARLAAALKRLRAEGAAILVVEHNIDFVSTIADEVLVMESGRLIARGTPAAVIADPGVQEAYFGALA